MTVDPVTRVIEALRAHGCEPRRDGRGWKAACPSHQGNSHALDVDEADDGNALVNCKAGCVTDDVLARIGLTLADLFASNGHTYSAPRTKPQFTTATSLDDVDAWGTRILGGDVASDERLAFLTKARGLSLEVILQAKLGHDGERYTLPVYDAAGKLVTVRRYLPGGDPKMLSEKGDHARLYGAEMLAALPDGALVLVVGGELDDLRARSLGYNAVSGTGGETCWREEWSAALARFEVVVSFDNDEAGRKGADKAVASLRNADARTELLLWPAGTPPKTDVTDYTVKQGHAPEEFRALVDEARRTAAETAVVERVEPATVAPASAPVRVWQRADIRQLLAAKREPMKWHAEGILAEDEAELVTAGPKCTKTMFALALSIALATGRPAFGRYAVPQRRRVLFVDEENGIGKFRRRLPRLVESFGLSQDEIDTLADGFDLRPQQGLSLASLDGRDTLRRAVAEHKADLVIFDSFTGLQVGEENSATDRRRFYVEVLAPLKTEFGCSLLLLAHPPLTPADSKVGEIKRPRGSGDSLAFADRAFWLAVASREKNEFGQVLKVTLEETHSREGGGLEPQLLVLEDVSATATDYRAEGPMESEGASKVGKVGACQWLIIRLLEEAGGRAYQPNVKKACEEEGYLRDVFYAALKSLDVLGRVKSDPPEPGSGKSGRWLRLEEVPE